MFFNNAGVEVSLWIPPCTAFVVSFFTSMGGVSGAFLLLPFQMTFLGYTAPSVSATNQLYNIVAIPSGVYRYYREGRMVWPLTWMVILGTLPGVFIGALIRVIWLPDARNFKMFAALVLFYIGLRMMKDLLVKSPRTRNTAEQHFHKLTRQHRPGGENGKDLPRVLVRSFSLKTIAYDFYGESYQCSGLTIFVLSLVVGVVGGIYGIGGGSIIAPFFISFLGLPVYTVAGPALMGTFVTSIAGVAFYQAIAPLYPGMSVAPDWKLGLLFGLGGMAGMYCGARCQKHVPANAIKWVLVAVIVFVAVKYSYDFVV